MVLKKKKGGGGGWGEDTLYRLEDNNRLNRKY